MSEGPAVVDNETESRFETTVDAQPAGRAAVDWP